MHATSSLQRLGLDHGADERAVKRAYARELKQIDQEHDAAGFQLLRHAYEMALAWARHKPADDADADAAPPSFAPPSVVPVDVKTSVADQQVRGCAAVPVSRAPGRDADTGESPAQLAQAVFDDFQAVAATLVATGQTRDGVAWRRQLQANLDDERLLNIAARAHFEFYVARLLADGWQSGHESLFVAARQVFGWEKDRRRLGEFGQLGAWLNQAIDECEMFNHQPSIDCSAQVDAVLRVRDPAEPGKRELARHVPHLNNMAARFPAWTAIIASTGRIEQWAALEQDLPAWRRRQGRAAAAGENSSAWWKVGLVLIAILIVGAMFTPSAPPPAFRKIDAPPAANVPLTPQQQAAEDAYQRAAGDLYMKPGTRTLDRSPYASPESTLPPRQQHEALPAPATPRKSAGRPPNAAERKLIGERIQFEWAHVEPRMYTVDIMVELDDQGGIKRLTKKRGSGLPVLDRHVEEAIRESAPFKAEISRRFGLSYSWGRMPPKKAASRDDTPPASERQAASPRA